MEELGKTVCQQISQFLDDDYNCYNRGYLYQIQSQLFKCLVMGDKQDLITLIDFEKELNNLIDPYIASDNNMEIVCELEGYWKAFVNTAKLQVQKLTLKELLNDDTFGFTIWDILIQLYVPPIKNETGNITEEELLSLVRFGDLYVAKHTLSSCLKELKQMNAIEEIEPHTYKLSEFGKWFMKETSLEV